MKKQSAWPNSSRSLRALPLNRMVKTAEVEILEAQTVCPGKYIVVISGGNRAR